MSDTATTPAAIHVDRQRAAPLDSVTVTGSGELRVRDGYGRSYHHGPIDGSTEVLIGGALGPHLFQIEEDGRPVAEQVVLVSAETDIDDAGGRMRKLLHLLHDTMFIHWTSNYSKGFRVGDKFYKYYVSWLRDHVHSLKGMKYFDDDIKTGIEIYGDSQREDGMIWDKVKEMCHSSLQNWRDHEFAEGDFVRPIPGNNPTRRYMRIPVENDVEYLYLEGLYYTWKACGDTEWMAGYLDSAIKAVEYSTSDRYRWSEKYQLLKRGYTIDTWDFQHKEDVARSGSAMRVDPDKTVFGVMHGDNTGMAVGCKYLSEMLRAVGRDDEADRFDSLGAELQQRLDELAWNGEFYTHHVSEDPSVTRETGVDEASQVSLSNSYDLNRRIDHDKCVKIIETYQRIRTEMPESSAGEFYGIYPPFGKGFGHSKWNYVNGGVLSIVAGELAHGAFEHGYEGYAVDILDRMLDWTERLGGHLHCTLKGKMPEPEAATFSPLDLREAANCDLVGEDSEHAIGWTGDGSNDLRNLPTGEQRFLDIAFDVIDPDDNDRRAAIGLSSQEPYHRSVSIPVEREAASLYFLHALAGGGKPVGWIDVHYADGETRTQYVHVGSEIASWFMPPPNDPNAGGNGKARQGNLRTAWQGPNPQFENVGVHVYGWNNPRPEVAIDRIELTASANSGKWMVCGITASDRPVQLPTSPVSYGIPDMWGAAAMVYAVIEGVAGVVDSGVAYDHATVSPRWSAAGIDTATATVVVPASGGYVSYRYRQSTDAIEVDCTSSGERIDLRVLLPEGFEPKGVERDGEETKVEIETVESSRYAVVPISGVGVHRIRLA